MLLMSHTGSCWTITAETSCLFTTDKNALRSQRRNEYLQRKTHTQQSLWFHSDLCVKASPTGLSACAQLFPLYSMYTVDGTAPHESTCSLTQQPCAAAWIFRKITDKFLKKEVLFP